MYKLEVFSKVTSVTETILANLTLKIFDFFMNCFNVQFETAARGQVLATNTAWIFSDIFMDIPQMKFEVGTTSKGLVANITLKIFNLFMNLLQMIL